ncbi:class II aldolase/adducin family protein [Croceibacterium aestuarii]|uniref:class II aldolase/adducin family protein n=1 Tax=Croceibacterium aestuarii TaxID=3064139 RepID=UPI00272EA6A3|nr:class II aldolase/adducin family protein [Croceibacterium sp. D39]
MSVLQRESSGPGNVVESSPHAVKPADFSAEEWAVRVDLAIAYRLFDWMGITDLIHTHISVRVPGADEQFLQLPYGHLFHEARASDMVKADPAGGIISDPTGLGISRGGFAIHSVVHMNRKDAACVMHAHTEASIAVANYRDGLLPLTQHALRFYGKTGYLAYCGLFDSEEKRASIARALGNADVLMLRNHGPLVIGQTVREAFSRMYYLERACRMQVASLSQCTDPDKELLYISAEDCRAMAAAFEGGESVIDREWNALVRMLDKTNPGYDE